jgi:hypothetical protein
MFKPSHNVLVALRFRCNFLRTVTGSLQVKVMLLPTVSRPVYHDVKPPSEAQDHIFITLRQLLVCWYGTPSLTRGRGLLFKISAGPRQCSHSRVRVCGTHDHIFLSQIRDLSSLVGLVIVFISPRSRLAQLYPQTLRSLSSPPYYWQGCCGGIRILHAWCGSLQNWSRLCAKSLDSRP